MLETIVACKVLFRTTCLRVSLFEIFLFQHRYSSLFQLDKAIRMLGFSKEEHNNWSGK